MYIKGKKKIRAMFIWSYSHVNLIKRGKFKKNAMFTTEKCYVYNNFTIYPKQPIVMGGYGWIKK